MGIKLPIGETANEYARWANAIWHAFGLYDAFEHSDVKMLNSLHEAHRTLRELLNEASTSVEIDDWERNPGIVTFLHRFPDNSILRYQPTAEQASVDEGDKWRASMWVLCDSRVSDVDTDALATARDAARVATLNALHAATGAKDRDMKTTLQTALTAYQML